MALPTLEEASFHSSPSTTTPQRSHGEIADLIKPGEVRPMRRAASSGACSISEFLFRIVNRELLSAHSTGDASQLLLQILTLLVGVGALFLLPALLSSILGPSPSRGSCCSRENGQNTC